LEKQEETEIVEEVSTGKKTNSGLPENNYKNNDTIKQ